MTTFTSAQSPQPQEPSDLDASPDEPVSGSAVRSMAVASFETPAVARRLPLSHRIDLDALWTVVRITLARQGRGRRLLVIAMLFTLPIVIAVLGRRYDVDYKADQVENVLIFGMIFQALVPLTALLFASGMVQDDIEEQTLTYLLIRPVPRWAIYFAKLMATFLVSVARAILFTTATLIVIHWDEEDLWKTVVLGRAPLIAALLALCLSAYVAIFGGLSLWVRRTLVIGAIYIVVFEGVLANIDFVVRSGTVMYYIRVLSVRWLELPGADWSIDLATAPTVSTCLMTLLSATAIIAVLGAWSFSTREFRVKTPEGS
jgi:ABC-2 type transport system permease protein